MGTSLIKIQTEEVREQVISAAKRAIDRSPREGADASVEIEVSRRELLDGIEQPTEFLFDSEHLSNLLGVKHGEISPDARAMLRVPADELRKRDATLSMQLSYAERSVRLLWTAGEPELSLSVQLSSTVSVEALRERAEKLLRAFAQRFLSMGMVLVLPAERKALASTYKQPQDNGAFDEVLSRPVVAFVNFLKSTEAQWEASKGTAMPSALEYLDKRILRGSVEFHGAGDKNRLMFVPRNGPPLPMHASSSMVRSLAGLDLYLRHGARKGDTLIIDEPEMNAHPEAQLGLVELLAYLVNEGIRVVLTTHSPYIVDHINNLIWARKLSEADQDEVAKKLALGTRECLLRGEDVAAYLFEAEGEEGPVRVEPIFQQDDPEHLIDWDTFSRTSHYLSNLYAAEILPRLYRGEE